MFTKEEFTNFLNSIREKLGEEQSALLSEDFIALTSNYNNAIDEIARIQSDYDKSKSEYDELLKVNGQLYLRLGTPSEVGKELEQKNNEEEEIKLEEIINEKGELI